MQPGTRIGRYEVREKIGAGGLGEVFLAIDSDLGREAAIKILNSSVAGNSQHVRRFVQEAKAASALNHPNLLTVYEIGKVEDSHFIASELIKGETLRERFRRGPLPLTEALNVASQMADGVSAAHKAGIIHRDIKPENTMIREDGLVKVLDFGLAKLFDVQNGKGPDLEASTQDLISTDPGVVRGTVHYMSPEQARGKAVDARTDVWSLGVVLYEMLTGTRPFEGETVSDVLASILKNQPAELPLMTGEQPAEVRRIILKALQKKPDERYQGVHDLALDLRACGKEIERSSEISLASGAVQIAGERRRASRGFIQALAIGLPILLLLAGVWFFAFRKGIPDVPAPTAFKTSEIISWNSLPGEGGSSGSISPDGKMIAFSSTKSGNANLWVKQTATGEAIQITNDQFNSTCPLWSPNGDEIAFISQRGSKKGVWRIAALGGVPTLIANVPDIAVLNRWAKNGMIYFEDGRNIFSLEPTTASVARLTDLDHSVIAHGVSISPDGTSLIYETNEAKQWKLWTAPIEGGSQKLLVASQAVLRNAVWFPDNRHLLYSSNPDGVYQIFATDRSGSPPVQITSGSNNSLALDVSQDGGGILYGGSQEDSDIWGVNIATSQELPLTGDVGCELWPAISPDGKNIAYQAIRNLSQGNEIIDGVILVKPVGTDGPAVRVAPNGFLPRWSADGKHVAYMRFLDNDGSIWINGSSGGGERELASGGIQPPNFTQLPYNRDPTNSYDWSPDGTQIAYISSRTGAKNLWIVKADASSDFAVTQNEDKGQKLSSPIWSPDGRMVALISFFRGAQGGKQPYSFWVADPGSKNARAVFTSNAFVRLIGWAASGNELVFAHARNNSLDGLPTDVVIRTINLDTGQTRDITTLASAYLFNIELSPDKSMIAFASRSDSNDNVWVSRIKGGEAKRVTDNKDPKLYFSNMVWASDGREIYYGRQSRRSLLSWISNFKF